MSWLDSILGSTGSTVTTTDGSTGSTTATGRESGSTSTTNEMNTLVDRLSAFERNMLDQALGAFGVDGQGRSRVVESVMQDNMSMLLPGIFKSQGAAGGYGSTAAQLMADNAYAKATAAGTAAAGDVLAKLLGVAVQSQEANTGTNTTRTNTSSSKFGTTNTANTQTQTKEDEGSGLLGWLF